jgi:type I site-specific restriction-modification system R (restriction) subunit
LSTLLQRVRQQLDQVGTLDLLRHGVEVLGLPKALKLAEFKPAFGLNPAVLARYNANRLRVVRQVRYSTRNENCLDLVLFVNGIKVWDRHSWLEILGRYCIAERDKKKQIRRLVFPRYHQLAVTRLLLRAVLEEGPGWRYLIQHSAGSGKTASIGWSSHLLADLHDENDRKVFDTVLVVSDRSVIDSQLQETLENFERRKGVVASITTEKGIKSEQLWNPPP